MSLSSLSSPSLSPWFDSEGSVEDPDACKKRGKIPIPLLISIGNLMHEHTSSRRVSSSSGSGLTFLLRVVVKSSLKACRDQDCEAFAQRDVDEFEQPE